MSLQVEIEKKLNDKVLSVSFDTEGKQGITGILGASGCGKSMTLKCIAGIETPDRGKIVLNGRVLFDSGKKINLCVQDRHVGYLFQNYALFRYMTVFDNVAFGLELMKVPKKEIKKRVMELLELTGLSGMEKRYPNQLSGGQRQRVAFARALAPNPQLLLLDEHTAALDPATADKVMEITRSIVSENHLTTLMITHNLSQALTTGNRTIMLDEGRIILDVGGEERAKMGVNDLLDCYAEKKKKAFDNDRMMLA